VYQELRNGYGKDMMSEDVKGGTKTCLIVHGNDPGGREKWIMQW
jgi:hypothetical protein